MSSFCNLGLRHLLYTLVVSEILLSELYIALLLEKNW